MSPVIREMKSRGIENIVVHTGQHYSYDMDRVFFEDLELAPAEQNLNVGSGSHAVQTGSILQGIEKVLLAERPDVVLVQGDTNTVLAGALAAAKLEIGVGHVEAGLRSFDRRMPEEINRIMADHISDELFPPTQRSKQNLLAEGIAENKIFVTGNTIVDAVRQNMEISNRRSRVMKALGLRPKRYLLSTMHRQENVDDPTRLASMIDAIDRISASVGLPAILPLHPRTKKNIKQFGLNIPDRIRIVDPVGYLDFLRLEAGAMLILTDSGGLQEEACILGVPCVTMRDTTERPETVDVGANVLVGTRSDDIVKAALELLDVERTWACPLGEGDSAKRIIDVLEVRY